MIVLPDHAVAVGVARFGREDPRAESRVLSVKQLVTRVTQVNNELQALRNVALFNRFFYFFSQRQGQQERTCLFQRPAKALKRHHDVPKARADFWYLLHQTSEEAVQYLRQAAVCRMHFLIGEEDVNTLC